MQHSTIAPYVTWKALPNKKAAWKVITVCALLGSIGFAQSKEPQPLPLHELRQLEQTNNDIWGKKKEWTANCGIEKDLFACPTSSSNCVKTTHKLLDEDGNVVYQSFDEDSSTYEELTQGMKNLSSTTEIITLLPGQSMCIYYWVGDRTCSVFP